MLPSGQFAIGTAETSPEESALWRGYYAAAFRVLELYIEGDKGLEKVAYRMNREGWAYRDRKGQPTPFEGDDIRRVVSNWPEYGGIVSDKRGKDRHAYEQHNPDEILFKAERAVFPLDLLRRVALVRQQRTVRPSDQSVKLKSHPYAFSTLLYCAHCAKQAKEQNNPRLRSLLNGNTPHEDSIRRYRHKPGVSCGCTNRSVPCEIVERDFRRLIDLLTVKPDTLNLMTELAIQADRAHGLQDDVDLEAEKQEAIAVCRRKIDAAVVLFGDGMIMKEEYRRRVEANEREIAHWEARTTETKKLAVELALCLDAIDKLARLWDISDAENKQGLVRSLFTQIVYNVDTQRIVDFRLKPWADRYLTLCASLQEDNDGGANGNNTLPPADTSESGEPAPGADNPMRNEMIQRPFGGAYSARPSAKAPIFVLASVSNGSCTTTIKSMSLVRQRHLAIRALPFQMTGRGGHGHTDGRQPDQQLAREI